MNTYFALVHKEPDSAFGISFPDLPGCISASDEEDDIFASAQSALALYASDEPAIPPARSLSQLRADPDVRVGLSEGAFLIAVPFIMVKKKARYNLMLPAELVEGVDQTAEALGVSRSEFVSEAIGARLKTQTAAVLFRDAASGVAKTLRKKIASKEAKSVAAPAPIRKVKTKKR